MNNTTKKWLIGLSLVFAAIAGIVFLIKWWTNKKMKEQLAAEKAQGIDIEAKSLESDLARLANVKQSVELLSASALRRQQLEEAYSKIKTLEEDLEKKQAEIDAKLASLSSEPRNVAEIEVNESLPENTKPNLSVVRDEEPIGKPIEVHEPKQDEAPKPTDTSEFSDILDLVSNNAPTTTDISPDKPVLPVITSELNVNTPLSEGDKEKMEYDAIRNSTDIEEWQAFYDSIEVHSYLKANAARKINSLKRKLDNAKSETEVEKKTETETVVGVQTKTETETELNGTGAKSES